MKLSQSSKQTVLKENSLITGEFSPTELNIEYFAKGENSNNWKIARDGCVVVMTNLDVAMDIINLEFK